MLPAEVDTAASRVGPALSDVDSVASHSVTAVSTISGSDRVPSSTPSKSNSSSAHKGGTLHSKATESSRKRFKSATDVNKMVASETPLSLKKPEEPSVLRRLVSVRVITAAMCFLLLIATAAVVLVVTSTFSLEAAQEIASKHTLSITNKAKSDIEDFLDIPVRYTRGWQYVLSREHHPLPRDETDPNWTVPWFQRLLEPMAATNFGFQYCVMGFNDGNMLVVLPVSTDKFRLRFYEWGNRNASDPTQLSNVTNTDYHRSNYSFSSVATGTIPFDPRTRSWFMQVPKAPWTVEWGSVYLTVSPTLPVINVAAPIYNASGVLIGATSMMLETGSIGVFLDQLDKTPNTMTFLIDNDGLLLQPARYGDDLHRRKLLGSCHKQLP